MPASLLPPTRPRAREWRVLPPDGEDVGIIRVPEGLVLEHIGDDVVVGSYRTDEGVEEVRVHSLERGRH